MLKAIKGILLYISIVLGIILACFLIAIIIMVVFPNLKLFGYGVIYRNQKVDQVFISPSYTTYNLTVNTDNFDIIIKQQQEFADISYQYYDNSLGLAQSELTKLTPKISGNNILLTLNEPTGILFYRKSQIVVAVPVNIKLNVTLKSSDGNIEVSDCDVTSLNITTVSGNFTIKNQNASVLQLSSLTINTSGGKFVFSDYEYVEVSSKTTITAKRGDAIFNNLISDFEVTGEDVAVSAVSIVTRDSGLSFYSSNGWLKVGTLNSVDKQNSIISNNCYVEIGSLYGNTRVKSTNGNIAVGDIFSNTVLETVNGQIDVNSAKENLRAETAHGNINVKEYFKVGRFKSVKGNINVNCKSEANINYFTVIENVDGSVNLVNRINKITINVSGRSNVHVKFDRMITEDIEHNIEALNGYIKVWIDPNNHFLVSATGNVSGNVGAMSMFPNDEIVEFPQGYTGGAAVCKLFVRGGGVVFYDYDQ